MTPTHPGPAVALRGLTKCFPARTRDGAAASQVVAVDRATLDVARGERLGLLGPNGAGKTTTILVLSTLLAPTEGTALVEGFDVRLQPQAVRRRIGVLLAGDRAVYRRLTGRENLLYFAELYGLPRAEARARAAALLDLVGLAERADDLAGRYSSGMCARLALARTMLHDPSVLLLDEPTVGLDPHGARLVRDLILSQSREGKTVLLATHDMAEAERLCDRVAVIDRGRLIAIDAPGRLKAAVDGTEGRPVTLEDVFFALTRRQP
ncbi:MAG: ABC transporter ATP-binding protein [Armatimonadota bacterium]|nr:ABC transporter ATP-binding protein [Armatimonadota bacterium]MDR7469518.1 ABC transporter ATP-binding protein [Armatimonadota bacterium]